MRTPAAISRRKLSREPSRRIIAALLAMGASAVPIAAHAAGFDGVPTVASGSATFSVSGSTQTVMLNSAQTIINWAPNDTATSAQPVNFLPAGQTVAFAGPVSGAAGAVLNRIVPADATRAIALNGTITADTNVSTWFYSPAGLLIGSGAVFNVGGLVLTTADPITTVDAGTGATSFFSTAGGGNQFSVAGVANGQSAITIQAGARIAVAGSSGPTYMVAIAPRIAQAGHIAVAGSTALVAAESATFAVDPAGLFSITVDAGSSVTTNTFVNSGSVGNTDAVANDAAAVRRVYMVAVPKNNAITMAITSGGTIGFAAAGAAARDGNAVILSAGDDIAQDIGQASVGGTGSTSLTIGAGTFSSNLAAWSTGSITATDPASGMTFGSNVTLTAPRVTVAAAAGTIDIAGNLALIADKTGLGAAPVAGVAISSGANLTIGSNAAALGVNGDLLVSANDLIGGQGGSAQITASGGTLTVAGNATLNAAGGWADAPAGTNFGGITTNGGIANVMIAAGGTVTVQGQLVLDARADGSAAANAYNSAAFIPDLGIDATGGTAKVQLGNGGANTLNALGGIGARADATGGFDDLSVNGGSATGGHVTISIGSKATLLTGSTGAITGNAGASGGNASNGAGGSARAGNADVLVNNGTLTMLGSAAILLNAAARGGDGAGTASAGGAAWGGSVSIQTPLDSGTITSIGSAGGPQSAGVVLNAAARGGQAGEIGAGGSATGGTAQIAVGSSGQSIAFAGINTLALDTSASGGAGSEGGGGAALAGTSSLTIAGGSLDTTANGIVFANATGGSDASGGGGAASGGAVQIAITAGGSLQMRGSGYFSATARGGGSINGDGGAALGGNILIDAVQPGSVDFHPQETSPLIFDSSYAAGIGGTPGTAASAGGARWRTTSALALDGPVMLAGNTSLVIAAGGNLAVNSTITGAGDGAYLQLWADNAGSGKGTVTLAAQAITLTGAGAAVDIDYNSASLGAPTDYAPGVAAGALTAYQLVNSIAQVQAISAHPDQNFALGRDIDASATQGWNGGAGFAPIAPFTGNFDGLGHAISHLYILAPGSNGIGLFGQVGGIGSGAQITIRNVGLIDPMVIGGNNTGALIGAFGLDTVADSITITNSYSTGGAVSGGNLVGGLIGLAAGVIHPATVSRVHSDSAVTAHGNFIGGLIGGIDGTANIRDAYATGPVIGASAVGGLIGYIYRGEVTNAYAAGSVTGVGPTGTSATGALGGLIGKSENGTVSYVYATGAVTNAPGDPHDFGTGGLIGENGGSVTQAWSSGAVAGQPGELAVGGLVGHNFGTIDTAYWDTFSTGQATAIGTTRGSETALQAVTSDLAQAGASVYALNPAAYANLTPGRWVFDASSTRPIGAWEIPAAQYLVAPVSSAHQVQLIDRNLAGHYVITQSIAMAGTGAIGDIWGTQGFIPIGRADPFTGTLAGNGHVLAGLNFGTASRDPVGLVSQNAGRISDLGLWNATVPLSGAGIVGLIAAINEATGTITGSFATGTITVNDATAGGLVGINAGTITQSYASVDITGAQLGGGLAGFNGGVIDQVYANGVVAGGQVGGLVGQSSTAITTAYWDSQRSGAAAACGTPSPGDCSGAHALTTAQTRSSSSFSGFAIDTSGGQGFAWRQYEGSTTPLLGSFLQPITVQPQNLTATYTASRIDPGYTAYGTDPALLSGVATFGGAARNVGANPVTYSGGLYSSQIGYDLIASATPGVVTITPAALTFSAVAQTRTYDATKTSSGVVAVSGLLGSDRITALSQSYDSANAGPRTLTVNSGYAISDGNSGGNYTVSLNTAAGAITPAALTLSAVSQTRAYDTTKASSGVVTVSGLLGKDAITPLSQSYDSANAGPRTLTVNSGYVISDGNSGGNYAVSAKTASGAITPAALTVTYTADLATSIYGDAIPALTGAVAVQGLLGSDTQAATLGGTAGFVTKAGPASPVGSYGVIGSGLSLLTTNYSATFAQSAANAAALTITARPITISALPASRSFGLPNPVLTYSVTGLSPALVNGDQLTGALATSATLASLAGKYPITQGTLAATANYRITYNGSDLTILPTGQITDIVSSIDTALPGSASGDGAHSVAAVRGAVLPTWVPGLVIDDRDLADPHDIDEPVGINGGSATGTGGTQP